MILTNAAAFYPDREGCNVTWLLYSWLQVSIREREGVRMNEAVTVTCPSCKANLKLKNRNSVGKKVPCPKCKQPFVVVADEAEVQRIIEKGHKQTRRPEFDFLETSPQILIAIINKNNPATGTPAAAGAPGSPGSMPAGMPGSPGPGPGGGANGLASLSNGKVPAWYIGITCTQDIEIQAGFSSPGAMPEVQADLEKFVAKQKSDFEAAKNTQLAMLPLLGLGDLIPQLEATVNSFRVSGNGSVAQLNAKVPGAIKGSIEKGMTAIAGMAGAGPGGLGGPNPFGGQAPGGLPGQSPPPTGGEGAPSSSSSNPAAAPQQPVP